MEFPGTADQAYEFAWAAAEDGVASRVLRGRKMDQLGSFYSEIGAALQFPAYFGENSAALQECLTDLSWMPADAYLLVVVDALNCLDSEPKDRFEMFVDLLVGAATEWATPVAAGEAWDRPSVPFHVMFQVEPEIREALRERFPGAGRTPAAWEGWTLSS